MRLCKVDGCNEQHHGKGLCRRHHSAAWHAANRMRVRARQADWRRRNPDKVRAANAAQYKANAERHRATAAAWRQANPEKAAAHGVEANARRAARKRGNGVEPYNRSDIFLRDRWECQLCGEGIDPALAWPDPASPSIDHIIPISRGGPDAPSNVQAAHLRCNRAKGAREAA